MALEAAFTSGSKLNRFSETASQKAKELRELGARGGYTRQQQARATTRFESLEEIAQATAQVEPMDFFATFFLMLPTAILLDVIDLIELTGVGFFIVLALKLTLGAVLAFFMYFAGKDANGTVGLAISLITFIVELLPGIDLLPVTTLAVILAYSISTPEFQERYRAIGEASQQIQELKARAETALEAGRKVAAAIKK